MKALIDIKSLTSELRELVKAAVAAQQRAYCPYSRFAVGAALLHPDNSITSGCNYENCTLQACCAERCAIVSANALGLRLSKAVAVYGAPCSTISSEQNQNNTVDNNVAAIKKKDSNCSDALCLPCGLCRQLLFEVAQLSGNSENFQVICPTRDKSRVAIFTLSELLPSPFGPVDVGVDLEQWAVDSVAIKDEIEERSPERM